MRDDDNFDYQRDVLDRVIFDMYPDVHFTADGVLHDGVPGVCPTCAERESGKGMRR